MPIAAHLVDIAMHLLQDMLLLWTSPVLTCSNLPYNGSTKKPIGLICDRMVLRNYLTQFALCYFTHPDCIAHAVNHKCHSGLPYCKKCKVWL